MEKTIWVVDDDPSISQAIQLILEDAGHETQLMETGDELRNKLSKNSPDLILMDVLLTAESGMQISKEIKTTTQHKNIPIILMSANSFTKEELLESNANAFLKKPFDMYDLVDLVNKSHES